MRLGFIVGFNPKPTEWRAWQEVLRAVGQIALADQPQREFGYTLKFASEDEYQRFVSEVQSRQLPSDSYFARLDRHFSVRDLESPLLRLIVRTAPRGLGGATYGTEYDLSSACPRCGTGARQLSSLYVKGRDAPRSANVWNTLDDEILVAREIAQSLDAISGVELRQARSADDRSPVPWFQLIPNYELPRMAASTEGIAQHPQMACPVCKRDGFFEGLTRNGVWFPSTIRYELDLQSLPDAMQTYEHFGRSVLTPRQSESRHLAAPLLIVRGHVFERLREAGARGFFAEPVDVLDASPAPAQV